MHTKEFVKGIRDYTSKHDMPFERYLMLTEVADKLEQLSSENKQLRNDLIMQTALAQNRQSAIETNRQLTKQLNAAVEDLKKALLDNEVCIYCKHNYHCNDTECDEYVEGNGCYDKDSRYYDWKWSCRDFDYGTCPKLEDTPCNGCDLINHFEWRGVQDE